MIRFTGILTKSPQYNESYKDVYSWNTMKGSIDLEQFDNSKRKMVVIDRRKVEGCRAKLLDGRHKYYGKHKFVTLKG